MTIFKTYTTRTQTCFSCGFVIIRFHLRNFSISLNGRIIQRLENIILRKITGAPWYISNHQLHQDLDLETVHQIAARATIKYVERLHAHTNTEAIMLLEDSSANQRFKRKTLVNIN